MFCSTRSWEEVCLDRFTKECTTTPCWAPNDSGGIGQFYYLKFEVATLQVVLWNDTMILCMREKNNRQTLTLYLFWSLRFTKINTFVLHIWTVACLFCIWWNVPDQKITEKFLAHYFLLILYIFFFLVISGKTNLQSECLSCFLMLSFAWLELSTSYW